MIRRSAISAIAACVLGAATPASTQQVQPTVLATCPVATPTGTDFSFFDVLVQVSGGRLEVTYRGNHTRSGPASIEAYAALSDLDPERIGVEATREQGDMLWVHCRVRSCTDQWLRTHFRRKFEFSSIEIPVCPGGVERLAEDLRAAIRAAQAR